MPVFNIKYKSKKENQPFTAIDLFYHTTTVKEYFGNKVKQTIVITVFSKARDAVKKMVTRPEAAIYVLGIREVTKSVKRYMQISLLKLEYKEVLT